MEQNVPVHFDLADAQRLYYLSFTKDQRLAILLSWHCSTPVSGTKTLIETWMEFIKVLLYSPADLALTDNGLLPFGPHHRSLCIPIERLCKESIDLVLKMYRLRKFVFSSVKEYDNDKFICSGFYHAKERLVFPAPWRRALLLNLCFYLETHAEFCHWYRNPMRKAIQALMLPGRAGHGDCFLLAMSRALQGICKLTEVQTWNNFFNDEAPRIISSENL